jgi:hypothetical protein
MAVSTGSHKTWLFLSGFLICMSASSASASSSWNNQPAWASGSEPIATPPTSRRARERSSSTAEVSPFSPGSHNISVDLGQVFMMGDLGDKYDSSIGTQVHYTYGVSDLFGFDGSVGYSEHSNGAFSMITALMGVRSNLAWYDRVVPYGVFGMGFYKPNYQTFSQDPKGNNIAGSAASLSPLLFGVHLGPGVDLALTKQVFFGASLTFHDIFGNTQIVNNQPFSVGGTFTTFLVRAGVTF